MLEDEFAKDKGKRVLVFDTILLPEKSKLILRFHKVRSKWRQGVWLGLMTPGKTDVRLTVAGQTAPSMRLWQHNSPKNVEIEVFTPEASEKLCIFYKTVMALSADMI